MLTLYLATQIIEGEAVATGFTDFIAVFPQFSDIEEAAYSFWNAQAGYVTGPLATCLGEREQLAEWLVTAHYLTLQGLGAGAEAQIAAQGAGGFKRFKSGSLELERAADESGEYGATGYGRQVWPMLRTCLAGPRVVGTGVMPSGYVPW